MQGKPITADCLAVDEVDLAFLPAADFHDLAAKNPQFWQELVNEAERRELFNHALLQGQVTLS